MNTASSYPPSASVRIIKPGLSEELKQNQKDKASVLELLESAVDLERVAGR